MNARHHLRSIAPLPGFTHRRLPASCRTALILAGSIALLAASVADAADSAWNVNADGSWITPGNWSLGVPGANPGTASPDVATFSLALTAARTVTVDLGRNIGGITFGNTSAFGYIVGTSAGSLLLTNGGLIQNLPSTGAHADAVSSPVIIQGDGGAATFTANATSGSSLLTIGSASASPISGVSTAGNTTTLTLNGTNLGNGSTATTSNVAGIITNGAAGGKLALVKDGTGTWSVGFASNLSTFTGGILINAGTLRGLTGTAGQAFGLGNAVTLANTAGAILDVSPAVQTIGSLAGGGTSGGNVTVGNFIFTLGLDNSNASFAGAITGATGAITKIGTGTQTFTGTNTYGGITRLNNGTLALDFSGAVPTSNIIAPASVLNLAGGTLSLIGKASTPNSQTFTSTEFLGGTASALSLTANAASNPLVLNLGALTRNAGTTLDVTLPAGVQSASNGITTTTTANSNGVLAAASARAYVTVGGTEWAGLSGSNIVTLTAAGGSYSAGGASYVSGNNIDVTDGDAPATDFTVNTLRFNGGTKVLTLNGTTNVVSTGGILVTSGTTASITGGTLRSSGTADALTFINNGTQLTVDSIVADNGADPTNVTLAGAGTTILNGVNTYTGGTFITGGTVKAGSASALGIGSGLTIADKAGAVLDLNGFDLSVASLGGGGGQGTSGQVTSGTSGGTVLLGGKTLTIGSASTATFGGNITGTGGSLIKVGTGTQTLHGANNFTGGITIKAGAVVAAGPIGTNVLGSGTITLGDSAGGSASVTLRLGSTLALVGTYNYSNPIVLAPNTTGLLDINSSSSSGSMNLSGGVTGPNNLRINTTATGGGGGLNFNTNPINNAGTLTVGGSTTNTNIAINGGIGPNVTDVTLIRANATSTNGITIQTGAVNNNGTISNLSTTVPFVTISAPIGTNITGIVQNSTGATPSLFTLSGTNTFRGPITISSGAITLGAAQSSGINSAVTLANVATAALNITPTTQNLGSLAGGGAAGGSVNLNAATASTLTIGSDHTSTVYSGVIGGTAPSVALRKIGTGTLSLTRASALAGGTLAVNGTLLLDYASVDPQGSAALTLSGGQFTFKGNTAGTTTDTVGTVTANVNTRSGIAVNNAEITTGAWTSGGSNNPVMVDLSSGANGKLKTTTAFPTADSAGVSVIELNDIVMLGTTSTTTKRANVYVKDANGIIGFATQNPANEIVRYDQATSLGAANQATATTATTNYKISENLNRTAQLNFQTLEISTASAAVTLSMNSSNLAAGTAGGRSILITGNNDALITSGSGVVSANGLQLANYGSGTTTLAMNLSSSALTKNGPGLVVYSGATMFDTQVTEGTLRFTTNLDNSTNLVRIHGGGIFELGADLNGATPGDFTKPLGASAGVNNVAMVGDGGFSAHGGDRLVNIGGAAAQITWGSGSFLSDPLSGSTDNDYIFKLGSATSTNTVEFANPIALGVRQRFVEVANGTSPTNVDGKLSGELSGTGGLTKTGAGTLEVSAASTFTGPTNVIGGTLQVSGSISASTAVNVTTGTLLLSGAGDKIGNASRVTLNGGTLKFADNSSGGFAESLGALILTSTSTLDFGSGTAAGNTFSFSSLSAPTIAGLNSGALALNVWNWSGSPYDPDTTTDPGTDLGQDRLLFGTLAGLNDAGLGQISFYSEAGSGFLGTGHDITFGGNLEIVPVPEPTSTALLGALGLFGLIGFRERRRFLRGSPERPA